MIARIWSAQIDENRASEYEAFALEISLPMFRGQPGFRGVTMLRQGSRCMVITMWDDHSAIAELEGSQKYLETVRQIEEMGFLRGDQSTEVFDIHLGFTGLNTE